MEHLSENVKCSFLRKKITINDIAKECRVAKSTVSEVINGNPKSRVRADTYQKVQKVIKECGYLPMQQARAMSNGHSQHLGVLISSAAMLGFANSYFGTVLAGIEHICSKRNYYCTVSLYDFSKLEEFVAPATLRNRSVDALIVAGEIGMENSLVQEMLSALGIPVVLLGHSRHEQFLCVDWENIYGVSFDYLAGLGHRNILLPYFNQTEYQKGTQELATAGKRCKKDLRGFFTDDWKQIGDLTRGSKLCNEVWSDTRFSECTALIANDQICCGFLQHMLRIGKRCPEDFSIISYDNTPNCEWNALPITTSGGNIFEYSATAATSVIDILENNTAKWNGMIALPHPMVPLIRGTTGLVPDEQRGSGLTRNARSQRRKKSTDIS